LEKSDSITFTAGIAWMFDGSGDESKEATENIVLATESKARLLSLYDEGWVVEQEIEPREEEDIEDVAEKLWMDSSAMLSEAVGQML